ncbi:hypothetical protein SCAR479_06222 [Seiridium cardinale]|uniref:Uncharacterized protein n=1 Tax=Seiridium cardinale TaxID=138064 RepID=A0ABR2XTL6_9PEZI
MDPRTTMSFCLEISLDVTTLQLTEPHQGGYAFVCHGPESSKCRLTFVIFPLKISDATARTEFISYHHTESCTCPKELRPEQGMNIFFQTEEPEHDVRFAVYRRPDSRLDEAFDPSHEEPDVAAERTDRDYSVYALEKQWLDVLSAVLELKRLWGSPVSPRDPLTFYPTVSTDRNGLWMVQWPHVNGETALKDIRPPLEGFSGEVYSYEEGVPGRRNERWVHWQPLQCDGTKEDNKAIGPESVTYETEH